MVQKAIFHFLQEQLDDLYQKENCIKSNSRHGVDAGEDVNQHYHNGILMGFQTQSGVYNQAVPFPVMVPTELGATRL